MNDNLTPEGPAHAIALGLLTDLAIVLRNAAMQGVEVYGPDGERIYDFGFWADQCDFATGVGLRRACEGAQAS